MMMEKQIGKNYLSFIFKWAEPNVYMRAIISISKKEILDQLQDILMVGYMLLHTHTAVPIFIKSLK